MSAQKVFGGVYIVKFVTLIDRNRRSASTDEVDSLAGTAYAAQPPLRHCGGRHRECGHQNEGIIALAILGIILAIAIPNLLARWQGSKQNRTVADLRSVAAALEVYHSRNGHYPASADLQKELVPSYMKTLPKDGWGREFRFESWSSGTGTPDSYAIGSGGRDGVFERPRLAEYSQPSSKSNFDADIVLRNGKFVSFPNATAPPDKGPVNQQPAKASQPSGLTIALVWIVVVVGFILVARHSNRRRTASTGGSAPPAPETKEDPRGVRVPARDAGAGVDARPGQPGSRGLVADWRVVGNHDRGPLIEIRFRRDFPLGYNANAFAEEMAATRAAIAETKAAGVLLDMAGLVYNRANSVGELRGTDAISDIVEALFEGRVDRPGAIVAQGRPAEALRALLSRRMSTLGIRPFDTRDEALARIREVLDRDVEQLALPALIAAADDPDPTLRWAIIGPLVTTGDNSALATLKRLLRDRFVRMEVIRQLRQHGHPGAIELLVKAFEETPNLRFREEVLETLTALGAPIGDLEKTIDVFDPIEMIADLSACPPYGFRRELFLTLGSVVPRSRLWPRDAVAKNFQRLGTTASDRLAERIEASIDGPFDDACYAVFVSTLVLLTPRLFEVLRTTASAQPSPSTQQWARDRPLEPSAEKALQDVRLDPQSGFPRELHGLLIRWAEEALAYGLQTERSRDSRL